MHIPDEEVQKAWDFLRDNAQKAAQATANRKHLENFTKSLKAILMSERSLDAIGAQERFALAHADFLKHLEGLRQAIYEDEHQAHLMEAAKIKINIWQSLSKRELAGLV